MPKQHKNCAVPKNPTISTYTKAAIKDESEDLLEGIGKAKDIILRLEGEYNAAVKVITDEYELRISRHRRNLEDFEKALLSLMKKNKGVLFDGTDVVNLQHGALIREKGDHVTIPKTALTACKENKFTDVIKTVESLDRDAIEKWPDAKLTLIGAARKPKEEFKYTI